MKGKRVGIGVGVICSTDYHGTLADAQMLQTLTSPSFSS